MLQEFSKQQPFFKEFCLPGSGHPQGFIYGWVKNDDNNLYVAFDVTSDNTLDGDKDYAKVNIKTENGLKVFRISVPETDWGKSSFVYTDKVAYQHKIYEFVIPLKELDIYDVNQEMEIPLAFTVYGTMSDPIIFSTDSFEVSESSGNAEILVTRRYLQDEYSYDVSTYISTVGINATAGKDYGTSEDEINEYITIKEGETQASYFIPIINDEIPEPDEQVELYLLLPRFSYQADMPVGPVATLTIKDDDIEEVPPCTIQFSTPTYTVAENGGSAEIWVTYSGKDELPAARLSEENPETVVSVVYSTSNGSAKAGMDYSTVTGTLDFLSGETEKAFYVPILEDSDVEGNETVNLTLSLQGYNYLLPPQLGLKDAVLTIIDNDKATIPDRDDSDHSHSHSSSSHTITTAPEPQVNVIQPPDGGIIIRMTKYAPISEPVYIKDIKDEILLDYDSSKPEAKGDYFARVCYWHEKTKNWVALTTYKAGDGKVKAINDSEYKGWFKVFGNIQPEFIDASGNPAEDILNRMNGLGIIEGFIKEKGNLIRTAQLEQDISRNEFTAFIYRLLNLNPSEQVLPTLEYESADKILHDKFLDHNEISSWSKTTVACMSYFNLANDRDGKFEPEGLITKEEAAAMVNKALKLLPNYKDADLTEFKTDASIPAWAKAALTDASLKTYVDGSLTPVKNISRSEALF